MAGGHEVAPTSPAQRTLWLLNRYRGGGGLMSVPVVLRIRGPLDTTALQTALTETVAHHEALRTAVEMRGRSLVQVIHPAQEVFVMIERPVDGIVPCREIDEYVRCMLLREPDVRSCPARAALWQVGDHDYVFALNVHHLVTDGWSNRLILAALGTAYTAVVTGHPVRLSPVAVRYADYARKLAQSPRSTESGQKFWAEALRGASFARLPGKPRDRPVTVLRTRQPRPPASHHPVDLAPETVARLGEVGRHLRATLFVMLLGSFMHALASLTGQDDLAVGSILANRAHPELHGTVGMFANMTVLRTQLTNDPLASVVELRRPVFNALCHQELHHGTIPPATGAEAANGSPGDAVFHMLARPQGSGNKGTIVGNEFFGPLDVEELRWPEGLASRFELELVLAQRGAGITGTFRYASDRLSLDWVRDLEERFTWTVTRVIQ